MVEPASQIVGKTLTPLYNMGMFEFERWAKMLDEGTRLALEVRSGRHIYLDSFYSLLGEMYSQWHGLMAVRRKQWVKEFDELFSKAQKVNSRVKLPNGSISVSNEYISTLFKIWRRLHDFKVEAGLSVPTRVEITEEDRLKRAFE